MVQEKFPFDLDLREAKVLGVAKRAALLSPGDVARRLGISVARVAQLREEGKLRGERTPLAWFYSEAAVARLEKSRKALDVRKASR